MRKVRNILENFMEKFASVSEWLLVASMVFECDGIKYGTCTIYYILLTFFVFSGYV